ncbi:MAG: hypothetical protein KC503_19090 [Myxococcales bacterium]|nr:hypothetical protein [Myxococcales bacterium]
MWFTRVWIVLLAAAAGLALGIASVVSGPAGRDLTAIAMRGLDRMQHNAELLLRIQARDWIDTVSTLASDATVVSVLERASDGAKEVGKLRDRASSRLLTLLGQLKAEDRPKLVIAVDAQGKQVYRLGPGEERYRPGVDGLIGYPVISQALRGYQLDDTWSLDGKLYLVAAAPVISRARGRYVGALLLGQRIDAVFASRLKARLAGNKTNVAFYLRGAMVASTVSTEALKILPRSFDKHRKQIKRLGRSAAIHIGPKAAGHTVVMAALPGEASSHDAFYAVVGPPPHAHAGLGEAIGRVDSQDMKRFPWLLVIGAALALAVLGILLVHIEGSRPVGRLAAELSRLAKGDTTRVEPRAHAGRLRQIAQAVNDAIERSRRAPGSVAAKDINQILGAPEDNVTRPGLSMEPTGTEMPPLAAGVKALSRIPSKPKVEVAPQSPMAGAIDTSPFDRGRDIEDAPTMLDSSPTFGTSDNLPSIKPLTDPNDLPSVKPIELPGAGGIDAPDLMPISSRGDEPSSLNVRVGRSSDPSDGAETDFSALLEDSGVRSMSPPDDEAHDTVMSSVSQQLAHRSERELSDPDLSEPTAVQPPRHMPTPEPQEPASPLDDIDAYFEQVYKDFIAIKRQCGENVENITYDRFATKLRKNRENLMSRYDCKGVKFQVYVKDGKAALKATPIKS